MLQRSCAHVEDAGASTPSVSFGGAPGHPAQFLMRGFYDSYVLILRDSIYYGPTEMVNRPQNTFNLDSLQIIRGPSSVIYGQGAIARALEVF